MYLFMSLTFEIFEYCKPLLILFYYLHAFGRVPRKHISTSQAYEPSPGRPLDIHFVFNNEFQSGLGWVAIDFQIFLFIAQKAPANENASLKFAELGWK